MSHQLRRTILLTLALTVVALPALARDCASVRAVIDGDTFAVDIPERGTHIVRLAGIEAAKRPLEVPSVVSWPLQDASHHGLERLIARQCLHLSPEPWQHDRYQRLLAQVETNSGVWVQAELVRDGLARVIPGLASPATTRKLLAIESDARQQNRGLWREPFYFVRTPDDVGDFVGTAQLVEGTVKKTARVKQRVYLNFGDDWRTDFTIVIPTNALRAFSQAGVQSLQLSGRRVRVRGLVEYVNGPMVDIEDPQAFELVEDQARESARRVASGQD